MNLLKNTAIDQVLGYFAAGQVAKNTDILDMQGYDGVCLIAGFGTIIEAGTLNVQVQQNTANSATGMAALSGTAAHTVTAANAALTHSCIVVNVHRPEERYVRGVVTPAGQNAVLLGVVAIRYCGRKVPITQAANVLKNTLLVSPDEA